MQGKPFIDGRVVLHAGDCLEILAILPDASVDSVVTDPPYGLSFMGKGWDHGVPSVEIWQQAFRVLKPGGHLLAFFGTRTYHRGAVAIEDAGFEIRDSIYWHYGSGFPKSLDVSKAIDRSRRRDYALAAVALGLKVASCSLGDWTIREHSPSDAWWKKFKALLTPDQWGEIERKVVGLNPNVVRSRGQTSVNYQINTGSADLTVPATDAAKGIGHDVMWSPNKTGRWPANLIHDGSEEVLAAFPDSEGQQGVISGNEPSVPAKGDVVYGFRDRVPVEMRGDNGSAARFFYQAKADSDDRLGSKHPTVKPVDLMQWLVRLVTPKGGVVLDPFAGTGTTGEAAWREGMRAILIEREPEYQADIARRMELATNPTKRAAVAKTKNQLDNPEDLPLFASAS